MLGIYHEAQRGSVRIICGVEKEYGEKHGKEDQGTPVRYGGEYKSDTFLKLCHDEGIVRHFTVRETPQQNEIAERMNKTLL